MSCLFCKIIKNEIPAQKVFENETVLGFKDIYPQSKEHYLFIHKSHTENILELIKEEKSLVEVMKGLSEFAENSKLFENGFRIVTNKGKHGAQSVFHTHFHLLGGEQLGGFGVN